MKVELPKSQIRPLKNGPVNLTEKELRELGSYPKEFYSKTSLVNYIVGGLIPIGILDLLDKINQYEVAKAVKEIETCGAINCIPL